MEVTHASLAKANYTIVANSSGQRSTTPSRELRRRTRMCKNGNHEGHQIFGSFLFQLTSCPKVKNTRARSSGQRDVLRAQPQFVLFLSPLLATSTSEMEVLLARISEWGWDVPVHSIVNCEKKPSFIIVDLSPESPGLFAFAGSRG